MSYLIDYIKHFHDFEVAVIGDLMLDKYIIGKATRISQEAPVPVVCVESEKSVPGGAANVALNLLSLHAKADVFGVVGNDAAGQELTELLENAGANTDAIIKVSDRPTTVKTRIIASRQQVVRVDKEEVKKLPQELYDQLLAKLKSRLEASKLDAIIMEDYAKGVFEDLFMEKVVELATQHHVPVMLDPHPKHDFNIKGIHMMTPNLQEACALTKHEFIKESDNLRNNTSLQIIGDLLKSFWGCDIPVITLGGDGMALFLEKDKPPLIIPTRAKKVFDVSGAGDTVMAAMTLGLLAKASPEDAAKIANYAAGIVVGIVGTAAIQYDDLIKDIKNDEILKDHNQ
ncbi:MAG: hypothetical protein IKZ46_04560 [Victivallales bacterium]|nr:hypothetical protein [Victivallales bacterium]